jgi:hypothetical protein
MPLSMLVGWRVGLLLSNIVVANSCRLSKLLSETTFEAIPHHQGAQLHCRYQSLLNSAQPFVSATVTASLCPGFLPITLQVLLVYKTLYPCVQQYFPKFYFGTTLGAFAITFPTAATSLRCKVAASYCFGELLVGGRESRQFRC